MADTPDRAAGLASPGNEEILDNDARLQGADATPELAAEHPAVEGEQLEAIGAKLDRSTEEYLTELVSDLPTTMIFSVVALSYQHVTGIADGRTTKQFLK